MLPGNTMRRTPKTAGNSRDCWSNSWKMMGEDFIYHLLHDLSRDAATRSNVTVERVGIACVVISKKPPKFRIAKG